jgi:tight adherence protein C
MTASIALGIVAGLGILAMVAALRPKREALAVSLRVLDGDSSFVGRQRAFRHPQELEDMGIPFIARRARASLRFWLGSGAASAARRMPSGWERLRVDLACTNCDIETLAEQCAISALAGALLPFLAWALLVLRGVHTPLTLPVWVGVIGAVVGALLPMLALRTNATKSRRNARRTVGCFLDLVVLALAGGLGIEGALHAAAAISDSPVSIRLVRALEVARDSGRTPWEALAALGRELGVIELVELASAVSLAGTEGARIKSTLAAKAASIRRHELAEAETDANTITDRLFIPGVLLLVGFLLFIGYPAVARLSAGL